MSDLSDLSDLSDGYMALCVLCAWEFPQRMAERNGFHSYKTYSSYRAYFAVCNLATAEAEMGAFRKSFLLTFRVWWLYYAPELQRMKDEY